jgi:hypothetical protein
VFDNAHHDVHPSAKQPDAFSADTRPAGDRMINVRTEVLIVGGGLGGIAAALACLRLGVNVVLVEEYEWLGGQLTSQAVPPDEHPWVESVGITRSYSVLREGIRAYYRRNYPLAPEAQGWAELNPGAGFVSRLCHEPRIATAVIDELLAPWRSSGRLTVLRGNAVAADVDGDRIQAVTINHEDLSWLIEAAFVVDATETGELLPLAGVEYVTGFESRLDTGEPSAPIVAQPDNMQAISFCFAVDHVEGDHTIDRPEQYERWRAVEPAFWGARLLSWASPNPRTLEPTSRTFTPNPPGAPNAIDSDQRADPAQWDLWAYRRIAARSNFEAGLYASDITLVNWPNIDYFEGPIFDTDEALRANRLADAKQLSLSMLYWMQTEAPRPDGGQGYRGLRLRGDVVGTSDGLAMAPYIRESRRILALQTITENDVSLDIRGSAGARRYPDSVGIGMYRIDLHPSTGGDNYIDVGAAPFEIPLGALIPRRMRNMLAACKNIGTTHITNGCYRLHPIEWNIGEVAGLLAVMSIERGVEPHQIHGDAALSAEFQRLVVSQGIETHWPNGFTGY